MNNNLEADEEQLIAPLSVLFYLLKRRLCLWYETINL